MVIGIVGIPIRPNFEALSRMGGQPFSGTAGKVKVVGTLANNLFDYGYRKIIQGIVPRFTAVGEQVDDIDLSVFLLYEYNDGRFGFLVERFHNPEDIFCVGIRPVFHLRLNRFFKAGSLFFAAPKNH